MHTLDAVHNLRHPEVVGDEQAVSLWRVDGGLRVLLAPADAWIGLPR